MNRLPAALAWAWVTALTGCSFSLGASTPGSDNRLAFSYSSGSCLLGCVTTDPLMVGTSESLDATGPMPLLTVVSTDPQVISVTAGSLECCTTSASSTTCTTPAAGSACPASAKATVHVDLSALSAGTATVRYLRTDGSEFDAQVLTVEAPESLSLTCGSGSAGSTFAVGKTCNPAWTAKDAHGVELKASHGVELTTSDKDIAALQPLFGGPQMSVEGDENLFGPTVIGVAAGDAVITAKTAALSASTSVHVTP
jgi:hypothetical protein